MGVVQDARIGRVEQRLDKTRDELKGDIEAAKSELKGDISTLREEVVANRRELQCQITSVRDELQGQITAVGTDVAALKGEVVVTRDVLLAAIQGLDRGPSR